MASAAGERVQRDRAFAGAATNHVDLAAERVALGRAGAYMYST
jgi:hypothetical protein